MMVFTIAVTEFSCSQNAEVQSSKVSDSTTNASKTQECPYKFLGIPIEGSMDAFAQKLEQKGFKATPIPSEPGWHDCLFSGIFSGYNVLIRLGSLSKDDDTIAVVNVFFNNVIVANISEILLIYKNLRDGLIQQYSNKGWLLDDKDDIKTLSIYGIMQALDRGTKFYFRIADPSVTLSTTFATQICSYIVLSLIKDSVDLVELRYYNPIRFKEMLELENRERNKDL